MTSGLSPSRPAVAGPPVAQGSDIGELYLALSARLERIVRCDVRAPDPVIEDACQFAWSRLVHHADRVTRESALSWLATTAIHEAYKLIRRSDRELSLEEEVRYGCGASLHDRAPGPDELLENRERLELIRGLPERQQRLLWLHGLGLSYTEMATYTGCTLRTVERQLLRAKRSIRLAAA